MVSKCKKCGDENNYNFALNIGLCNLCLGKELESLQAENEQLKDLFERIRTWANAYPLTVFPKPDLKKAHKVLKAAGMTLDAISADAMRHVLEGIKKITEQAAV